MEEATGELMIGIAPRIVPAPSGKGFCLKGVLIPIMVMFGAIVFCGSLVRIIVWAMVAVATDLGETCVRGFLSLSSVS